MLAGRSLDIFDDLLASALAGASCLSHLPLFSGYDEPRILSYQIALFGPIGADVRHLLLGIGSALSATVKTASHRNVFSDWMSLGLYGVLSLNHPSAK
jgi:hypothetical protein